MSKPVVYLDICAFNRPFDDQASLDIKFEAEAKLYIQERINKGDLELAWSYIIEFENAQNPFPIRKYAIGQWRRIARYNVCENDGLIKRAMGLTKTGLKPKDVLHISSAIEASADYFITTDKGILRKMEGNKAITVIDPVDFLLKAGG